MSDQRTTTAKAAVYVVTCLKRGAERRQRTWGWYTNLDEAEHAVLHNHTDMFEEAYYDLAVVERIEEGILGKCVTVSWFRARYSREEREPNRVWHPKVERIEQPEWLKGICGWGMG